MERAIKPSGVYLPVPGVMRNISSVVALGIGYSQSEIASFGFILNLQKESREGVAI